MSNTSNNNGVMGFSNLLPNNTGNSITCSDTTIGTDTMFYQKDDFIGYSHIQHLVFKNKKIFNKNIALFFIVAANMATKNKKYDYGNKFNRIEMNNTEIYLPVNMNNDVDYEFMYNYIQELEAYHIQELEAYLLASELKDYKLNKEERNAIESFDINKINWNKFNLEELFGKSSRGKRLKSDDRRIGTLPFVTAGEGFEGVSAYISNNVDIYCNNTITIDMFGSAKYRNYKYGCDDHVAVVHTENINKYATIFITSAIHKSSHNGQFNYGKNFYASDADELDIMLPVDNKGSIDYNFMINLISAVQKLVIKDVVLFSDEKIKATKQVVNNKVNGNKKIKDTIFNKKLAAHIDVSNLVDKIDSN